MADPRPGMPVPVPGRVGPHPTRMPPAGPAGHRQRCPGQDPVGRGWGTRGREPRKRTKRSHRGPNGWARPGARPLLHS
eukprot:15471178-Alexandrium_andersonii.AAC.1